MLTKGGRRGCYIGAMALYAICLAGCK